MGGSSLVRWHTKYRGRVALLFQTFLQYLRQNAKTGSAVVALCIILQAAVSRWGPLALGRLHAIVLKLPQPKKGLVQRRGGVLVPGGSEGIELATVMYIRQGETAPTMLIRTPYNKYLTEGFATAIAVQGFNVILQDCRGRFASTGEQSFAAYEDLDGVATLAWLSSQNFEWFDPARVVMFGISYLGVVQWALVAGVERHLSRFSPTTKPSSAPTGAPSCVSNPSAVMQPVAIAPLFAASQVHSVFFRHNAFTLDFYIRYIHLMTRGKSIFAMLLSLIDCLSFEVRLQRGLRRCLGLRNLHAELGVPFLFRYNSRLNSRFWQNRDYSDAVAFAPPALIATGWYDIFLEGSLADYEGLVKAHGAGHSRLLVGPWTHLESILSRSAFSTLLGESLEFLSEHLGVKEAADEWRLPVRLWIMGARASKGKWRDFSDWPPNEVEEEVFLIKQSMLVPMDDVQATPESGPTSTSSGHIGSQLQRSIVFDPLRPTPAVGGCQFSPVQAGEKDQRRLEARDDVLTFDSAQLQEDVVVVGRARLRLSVQASLPHFDVFARLCDVHPNGRSYNVCDAVLRTKADLVRAESEQDMRGAQSSSRRGGCQEWTVTSVDLTFFATAKCFQKGHTIRLLIACGAFPYIARHFGDVEQAMLDDPLEIKPCELRVLDTEACPSSLWLPVVPNGAGETPTAPMLRKRSYRELAAARWSLARRRSRDSEIDAANLRKSQSEATLASSLGVAQGISARAHE